MSGWQVAQTAAQVAQVLVSVRTIEEAQMAASAGVGFIDLKEPRAGALGGLDVVDIRQITAHVRAMPLVRSGAEHAQARWVSATIGDWPAEALRDIESRVWAVAQTGVDHVKVGVVPGPGAQALVHALGRWRAQGVSLVPVLIADAAVPTALLQGLGQQGFTAVMLDTQDKRGGSLLQRHGVVALQRMLQVLRMGAAPPRWIGLAGALQWEDLPQLVALQPDFVGFRSAVCVGDRGQALDVRRVLRLTQWFRDWGSGKPARSLER